MKRTFAAVLMLSAALSAGAASAQSSLSREVSIRGVDFDDAAQVERLYQRLKRAARNVCADPGWIPNNERAVQSACASAALDQAVDSLDRPQLRLVHDGSPAAIQVARR